MLSDFGRLYSDSEGRTISFKLAHPNDKGMKQQVIQSMQDRVSEKPGKLMFTASKVVSAQGLVKRYIVQDITKAQT